MNKIAIFGGSFNPVHKGHINICEWCQKEYDFDKILLIPTHIPPHKQALNMASGQDRLNMLKLATKGLDYVEICDIELKERGISYTFLTLEKLKKIYQDTEFYLIVGSDMFFIFEKWVNYENILKNVTLITGARHENEYNKLLEKKISFEKFQDKIDIINLDIKDVSSTQIRDIVKNNVDVEEKITKDVLSYILKNNLYID